MKHEGSRYEKDGANQGTGENREVRLKVTLKWAAVKCWRAMKHKQEPCVSAKITAQWLGARYGASDCRKKEAGDINPQADPENCAARFPDSKDRNTSLLPPAEVFKFLNAARAEACLSDRLGLLETIAYFDLHVPT